MHSVLLLVPLGLLDRGIFSDLDTQVALAPPPASAPLEALVDEGHHLLLLYSEGAPRKAYPLGGAVELVLGAERVALRADDVAELTPRLPHLTVRRLARGETSPGGDRDGDGIPDALDIAIGAKKVALNGAQYGGDYIHLPYPAGDVPRAMGVCTDVVVRALRNAGIDLQAELYEDIGRAPRAYPMVKRRDPNIDQRRVKTILPWFRRHFRAHGTDPTSKTDPFLPGDIVFFDTFPSRSGPDHIGVVSDRIGDSGLPLVVNNWTEGYREAEMDLLGFVPVTDRFRAP